MKSIYELHCVEGNIMWFVLFVVIQFACSITRIIPGISNIIYVNEVYNVVEWTLHWFYSTNQFTVFPILTRIDPLISIILQSDWPDSLAHNQALPVNTQLHPFPIWWWFLVRSRPHFHGFYLLFTYSYSLYVNIMRIDISRAITINLCWYCMYLGDSFQSSFHFPGLWPNDLLFGIKWSLPIIIESFRSLTKRP